MIKKILTIISIIIFIILILLFSYKFYEKNSYSLEKVEKMLNSVELPENFSVKENLLNGLDENVGIANYLKNDKGIYIYEENNSNEIIEQIYNFENKNNITIIHSDKIITDNPIDESYKNFELLGYNTFFTLSNSTKNNLYEYTYNGKNSINGKNCIKVSFVNKDFDKINKYIFYININNHYIQKLETYTGNNLNTLQKNSTKIYEYSFNEENIDDKIINFNLDNYTDYQYISNK